MPKAEDAQRIIDSLESSAGRSLEPEEQAEIELWQKGRALAQLTGFYGWQVAREMLQSYVTSAMDDLVTIDPSDEKGVRAGQAVAYAANQIYTKFVQDVAVAIEAAHATPESVKRGLRQPEYSA